MNAPLLASILFCSSMLILSGCQSIKTITTPADSDWSAATSMPRLLQTMTKYQWTLTHVSNNDGKFVPFQHQPPLTMDVRPDLLTFDDGCYQHSVFFYSSLSTPYPYTGLKLQDVIKSPDSMTDCTAMYKATTKNRRGNIVVHSDTAQLLDNVFKLGWSIPTDFKIKPQLIKSEHVNTYAKRQVALETSTGKTLLLMGTPKPKHKVAGIPITNELLEYHHWHLIKATDSTDAVMDNFTDTERPIVASYYSNKRKKNENGQKEKAQFDIYDQTLAVSGGCDIVMGSYVLSVNQTLVTSGFPALMTGCSENRNNIETHLRRMMLFGTSQLTLTTYMNNAKTIIEPSEPRYLLTQKTENGETLLWRSIPKDLIIIKRKWP